MVLPEAALLLGKKTLRLEGPHEASVDHPLHRFVLHKQLVSAIGLNLSGSKWSLPGLGMGTTNASHHDGGKKQQQSIQGETR